ncbi:MAG: hypothetical protein AAF551_02025 [Bacteroidota bacterium]
MLKTLLAFALLVSVCFQAFSQKYIDTDNPEDEKIKSLINTENDLNGFGGIDLKVGDFKNERSLMVGGCGGLVINRRFLFGIAGYGLAKDVEFNGFVPQKDTVKTLNLFGGYGGILVGATIAPKELVHISIPIVLGAGAFEIEDQHFFSDGLSDREFVIENSVFFIIEPGLEIEFNVSSHFRLGFGATYRYITDLELINLSDEEVTGATGMVSLRFGRF